VPHTLRLSQSFPHTKPALREKLRFLRRYHQATLTNYGRHVTDVGCHNRNPARHGLSDGVWKTLAERGRQSHEVEGVVDRSHVGALAGPHDAVVETFRARKRLHFDTIVDWTVTDADKTGVSVIARKQGCGGDEIRVVLHVVEAGDFADEKMLFADPPLLSNRASSQQVRPHRIDIDAVRDIGNAIRRKAARGG